MLWAMLLIDPDELRTRLGDPRLAVFDVRWSLADPTKGRRAYLAAHIPGARFVDVDTDLVAAEGPGRHPLPSPDAFAARMQALGLRDGDEAIVYDDTGGTIAARLWWMLDDLGFPRVRVLDGGIPAWATEAGEANLPTRPGTLTLAATWSRTIDRAALTPRLGSVALLDARAPERYRGDIEPIDPVAGHIPTALNRPLSGNLGPDGRFLPPEQLATRFAGLGDNVVVACGSGITACHNALAMRLAGLPAPLLYPGSYSDWSRAGMPVATGDLPGSLPR
jgi:thiosulfate/3-mercaptopyruvate sulfurtransferase